MVRQIVVYPYHGILLNNKREQTINDHNVIDKPQNDYTERKQKTYCMVPFM